VLVGSGQNLLVALPRGNRVWKSSGAAAMSDGGANSSGRFTAHKKVQRPPSDRSPEDHISMIEHTRKVARNTIHRVIPVTKKGKKSDSA
jgi:hypothetical protein